MEVATAEADTNEAAVHTAHIAEQKGKKVNIAMYDKECDYQCIHSCLEIH